MRRYADITIPMCLFCIFFCLSLVSVSGAPKADLCKEAKEYLASAMEGTDLEIQQVMIDRAFKLCPNNPEILFQRGMVYKQLAALETSPEKGKGYVGIAIDSLKSAKKNHYRDLKALNEALSDLKRAEYRVQRFARLDAQSNEGTLLVKDGDLLSAEDLRMLLVAPVMVNETEATGKHSKNNAVRQGLLKQTEEQGKGRPSRVAFKNIHFAFDSYELLPSSFPQLRELGRYMTKLEPKAVLLLEGHTDRYGTKEYNDALSLQRANGVKKYLVGKYNVEPGRLIVKGYGYTRPFNKDNPYAGINRRVEISRIQ